MVSHQFIVKLIGFYFLTERVKKNYLLEKCVFTFNNGKHSLLLIWLYYKAEKHTPSYQSNLLQGIFYN